ncbi:hypothetical protein SUGI_0131820 [Cryptomeria japonica]|uniref:uncharacterized protein LOC131046281 n=1 Tax=Cryptomeria japonica TaxID=3369 RepID=UPI002408B04D|nr:uncharacterized protein LOC131046281 [Cryptomeria japonica]GLJ10613.1 hypothetical protein SUGI_0131820 [Cryptomeria japonica]
MADKSFETMNVRFLINTRTRRIIYAEAGKEFVDFLFSFLSMPVGYVLKLLYTLTSKRNVGSVSNLYDSIEKLPSQYMSTDKSPLLDPEIIIKNSHNSPRIEDGSYYVCSYLSCPEETENWSECYCVTHDIVSTDTTHNMSSSSGDKCICGNLIERLVQLRPKASGRSKQSAGKGTSGYVKEMLTFIITDDLKIKGSSTITSIMLLNHLDIKDLTDLQERTAIVDEKKSLEILEASMVSTTVLNDVFGAEFFVSGKVSLEE